MKPESVDSGFSVTPDDKEGQSNSLRRKTPASATIPEPNNTKPLGSGTGVTQSPLKLAPLGSPPVKKMLTKNGSPLISRSPPGRAVKVIESAVRVVTFQGCE